MQIEAVHIQTSDEYRGIALKAAGLYNEKKFQQALEEFKKLAEYNPSNAKVHEVLAYIYLRLEQPQQAQEEYELYYRYALEQNPRLKKIPSFDEVVNSTRDEKILKEEYAKLIEAKSDADILANSSVPIELAIQQMHQGDYQQAEKTIQQYIDKFVTGSPK